MPVKVLFKAEKLRADSATELSTCRCAVKANGWTDCNVVLPDNDTCVSKFPLNSQSIDGGGNPAAEQVISVVACTGTAILESGWTVKRGGSEGITREAYNLKHFTISR